MYNHFLCSFHTQSYVARNQRKSFPARQFQLKKKKISGKNWNLSDLEYVPNPRTLQQKTLYATQVIICAPLGLRAHWEEAYERERGPGESKMKVT